MEKAAANASMSPKAKLLMFFIFVLLIESSVPDISEHTHTDTYSAEQTAAKRSLDQENTTAQVGMTTIGQS